jgi:alpha-tubulin suppressor-like RCC1 family protein
LAVLTHNFQQVYQPYFLFGSGSNQHNQLLLASDNNAAGLMEKENAHRLTDILLCATRDTNSTTLDLARQIVAGGGHSGLLTERGRLFLWGWNENGQLGTSGSRMVERSDSTMPLPVVSPLQDVLVEKVALGFFHTLVIEKVTGYLYAFGNNERGQVNGIPSNSSSDVPQQLAGFTGQRFVGVAGGLLHSAAISAEGELFTFGCKRFGQTLSFDNEAIGRWKPYDGSKLVQVACGRHHSVVLDEYGRIWTFGENKYGQLGRQIQGKFDAVPALVDFDNKLGLSDSGRCCEIIAGWSHTIAKVDYGDGEFQYYGWGRNDKGQLGLGQLLKGHVQTPVRLFESISNIQSVVCGSESTMLCQDDGSIWGCGWNEHGNLSLGTTSDQDALEPTRIQGARITSPPTSHHLSMKIKLAAGGAHFLAMLM